MESDSQQAENQAGQESDTALQRVIKEVKNNGVRGLFQKAEWQSAVAAVCDYAIARDRNILATEVDTPSPISVLTSSFNSALETEFIDCEESTVNLLRQQLIRCAFNALVRRFVEQSAQSTEVIQGSRDY